MVASIISDKTTLRLKIIGSIIDVNKAPKESVLKAIATFETLID